MKTSFAGLGLSCSRAPTFLLAAFAFYAPEYDAVLLGTHNDSDVVRWPLIAAVCQELRVAV